MHIISQASYFLIINQQKNRIFYFYLSETLSSPLIECIKV